MRGYFSQFGTVTHLRMSRNRRTGKSKHYAFIQFAQKNVAQIVAETMDGYILFGRILKCQVISEEGRPNLWKGADQKFKTVPWDQIERRQFNMPLTKEKYQQKVERLIQREEKLCNLLNDAGIDYTFPSYKSQLKVEEPKKTSKKRSLSSETKAKSKVKKQ